MKCQEIVKVEPLSEAAAWKLFSKGLGRDISSEIQDIAMLVATECAGLPLGIIVMAGSMRGVDDIQEWRNTLEELRNSTEGQTDIETDVLPVLKLSYDRLKDPKLRQCFLLCALYPKDGEIKRDELITLFRSEGLLDGMKSWQKQFDKAHSMINKLENVCLLENCSNGCVKLHNLIRDMAIRITKVMPRFMIAAGSEMRRIPSGRRWTIDLDKVSLMNNSLSEIEPGTIPMCQYLSTLLLQQNPFTKLPDNFFVHMKGLKVLNLSKTSIKMLPSSVSELKNLRSLLLEFCTRLRFVPSLAKLTNLMELDFSFCWSMKVVPHGMELLANLRFLDLEGSKDLCRLLMGSLCNLSHIQCLKLDPDVQSISGAHLLKLEHLERLEGCRMADVSSFNEYVKTRHFQQLNYYEFVAGAGEYKRIDYSQPRTDGIARNITTCEDRIVVLCSRTFKAGREGELFVPPGNTPYLQIHNCNFNVRSLVDALSSLNSLTTLKKILIRRCRVMECIWPSPSHFKASILSLECLTELVLIDLPDFSGLLDEGTALPKGAFSNLEILVIKFCPKIKTLFTSSLLKTGLVNLKELEVEGCENLEAIVAANDSDADHEAATDYGGNVTKYSDATRLPSLRALQLTRLPKLTSICQGGLLGYGSIESIVVEYCAEIKQIFMSSLPLHHLRNLRKVKVACCQNLQEIISLSDSSCQKSGNIELPSLRALHLDDLPRMTSFSYGMSPTCGSIERVSVRDCPRMKRLPFTITLFSNGEVEPPFCLQEIKAETEWWESLEWDDFHLKQFLQPLTKLVKAVNSNFKILKELVAPVSNLKLEKCTSTTGGNGTDMISSCLTE